MLKIKDNVDLKELEKFGFKILKDDKELTPLDDDYFSILAVKNLGTHYTIIIDNDECYREISIHPENSTPFRITLTFQLDVLYDLIKADLVEKVSERE